MAFSQMVVVIAVLFSLCCVENIDDSNYREELISTKHLKIMIRIKRERETKKRSFKQISNLMCFLSSKKSPNHYKSWIGHKEKLREASLPSPTTLPKGKEKMLGGNRNGPLVL